MVVDTAYFFYYLVVINFFSFGLMGLDKFFSKRKMKRISENTFFWLAALGASPGVYAAMPFFRHKHLKKKFRFGIPAIFMVQAAVLIYFAWR